MIHLIKWIGLVLVWGLGFGDCYSQNPLVKQWDKRFGGTGGDPLYSFQQTADGGYILGGFSNSDSSGDKTQPTWGTYDYWIVKTDSLGNKQWDKDFGGTGEERFTSLQQTADRGYILGGFSMSGISGDKTQSVWGTLGVDWDYWIIKIDSLGNKQWDKDFGGTNEETLFSLKQTADGGYIFGGNSFSGISGDKTQTTWGNGDYWIVKTDSLGNKQWDKNFGGTNVDVLSSIYQTIDGGYVLGGNSASDISGDKSQNTWGSYDYWIIKIDSMGNKQWDKDFGGTDYDYPYSLQQTADGGYILGGYSSSDISGDKTQNTWGFDDFWILKIDSLGNKQWDKDFGGANYEDEFGNISQTKDGGYLIAGTSYSPMGGNKTENNLGQEQSWILKTDSNGIIEWDKTIFTTGHDESGFAIQTKDECYAIANLTTGGIGGYKTQPSWGSYDYWIIKFCDTTLTTSITQLPDYPITFSIFPNPTTSTIQLTFNTKHNGAVHCEIINVMGERVYASPAPLTPKGESARMELDVSFLAKGIYFIKVIADGKSMVQKVVKM